MPEQTLPDANIRSQITSNVVDDPDETVSEGPGPSNQAAGRPVLDQLLPGQLSLTDSLLYQESG